MAERRQLLMSVETAFLTEPGPGGLFSRLSRIALLLDDFHARCFDPFNLRFIDYSVLRVLQLVGPPYRMSPSELSGIVVRSTGGMTVILDRLERDHLVQRSPDPADRRKVIIGLTAEGLQLVDRANRGYVERKAEFLGHLSDEEFRQVEEVVLRLLDLFAREYEDADGQAITSP